MLCLLRCGHSAGGNPNGIAAHSPRLPYSATLGRRCVESGQPQSGLRRGPAVVILQVSAALARDANMAVRSPT
jgi:hypothetical protein